MHKKSVSKSICLAKYLTHYVEPRFKHNFRNCWLVKLIEKKGQEMDLEKRFNHTNVALEQMTTWPDVKTLQFSLLILITLCLMQFKLSKE